ncbi:MAG: hypothetical protein V4449_04070 [Patescibacteria group bacterium]
MTNIVKKSGLLIVAIIAVFSIGAWFSMDVANLSFDQTSITAEAAGVGCGGCGYVDFFLWGYQNGPYENTEDRGGGGGGVPPSCKLDGAPSQISAGESATLSWTTKKVTVVSIDNGVGTVAKNGSTSVSPSVTTTYTLTGSGPSGTVTCQKTIVVESSPMPVCSADLSKDRLIWNTVNATSVTINTLTAGSPVVPAPHGLSGSYNFVPALGSGTHTYNLTATGPGGSVLCAVTVTITPEPAPTCTLSANPTSINEGGSSTLSWTTTNVTSVNINQGIGSVTQNGSTSVSPNSSTVYTLTATGPGGTVTCAQGVTVIPAPLPVCILDLSPSAISWTTIHASSVTLVSTTGSPAIPSPGLNGSFNFNPDLGPGVHSYTLTATGAGGSVVCMGTIHIDPPPSAPFCTLDASPSTVVASSGVIPGGSAILSWTTANVSTISIDQGVGSQSLANGSVIVVPSVTTTYTLTATGAGGTVTCQKTITVASNPAPSCSLTASVSTITAGNSATLSWTTAYATSVSIVPGIGAVATNGSASVHPTVTTTYTLTATGPGGTVTCQKIITVTVSPAPVCSIDLSKNQISWSTTNATAVVVTPTTASPTIPVPQGLSGSFDFTPPLGNGTHTYSLTATGPGGSVLCGVSVTVTPNPAPTCTLDATPSTISSGGSSTLTWTTTNASSVNITQGIGSVTANGSRSVSPASSTTYALTATGAGGTVTCQQTIVVTPPATPACVLSATPSSVNAGDASALSWTTTNAVSASIDHGVGAVTPVISGATAVSISNTITYTMTVTSGFGATATCQTTITVTTPGPACTITVSRSSIRTGESVTVSWTSANATSGSITGGIGSVSPVAGGSIDMFPPSDTTYTGTFTGPNGTASCQRTVIVTPPSGCTTSCGGGLDQPNVVMFKQLTNQPLAFVSLSQIPYTGFDAGPALTILFWLAIGLLSAFAAYFVAGKGGIRYILGYAGGRFIPQHQSPAEVHEHQREALYGTPYPNADIPVHQTAPAFTESVAPAPVAYRAPVAPVVPAFTAAVVVPPPQAKTPAVDGVPDVRDVIESRAHAAGVLMSPEAVTLAVSASPDRVEALRIFGNILNEAVRTVPRENGWVMLTTDRFADLAGTEKGTPIVPPTASAFAPSEPAPISVDTPTKTIDTAGASAFAGAVALGNRDVAFGIIRSFEHDGVSPTALLTSTATVLDTLYRTRKDNRPAVDTTLADSASHLSDEQLASLVNIFTHSLDTVYASPFTGVKLALAQAFEVVG